MSVVFWSEILETSQYIIVYILCKHIVKGIARKFSKHDKTKAGVSVSHKLVVIRKI